MNDQELQRVFEEVQSGAHQVNPDWVAAGPEHDVHFMFHPDVIGEYNRPPMEKSIADRSRRGCWKTATDMALSDCPKWRTRSSA